MPREDADLTIVMPTYNKEKYIAESLDSIFAQQTNYRYRIIVADDCSTDNTLAIIKKYQNKHPGKLTVLTSNENQKLYKNVLRAYKQLKTKYWCVLDPDDYWCDVLHIQKSLDFLETHPDFTIYGSNMIILSEDGKQELGRFSSKDKDSNWNDYLKGRAVIPFTQTTVFRNIVFCDGLPEHLIHLISDSQTRSFRGDSFRNAIHIQKGKAHYTQDPQAVYRLTTEGIFQGMNKLNQHILNCGIYKDLWLYFDKKYPELLLNSYLFYINHIIPSFPQEFKSVSDIQKQAAYIKEIIEFDDIFKENKDIIKKTFYKTLSLKNKIMYFIYKKIFKKIENNGVL